MSISVDGKINLDLKTYRQRKSFTSIRKQVKATYYCVILGKGRSLCHYGLCGPHPDMEGEGISLRCRMLLYIHTPHCSL